MRLTTTMLIAVLTAPVAASAQTLFSPGGSVGVSSNGNVGVGTSSPAGKLELSYQHGQYFKQVLPASSNGGGTGEAGLYMWISEPWWSWTGAGIGRNVFNNGGWGTRTNPNLTAQMIQFREDPTIAFSIWDASGSGYNPLTLNNNNALFSGNVGIGTSAPDQKLTIKGGGIGFDHNSSDKKLYSPTDGVLEWMTHEGALERAFAVSHQGQKRVYLNALGNSYLTGGNLSIGATYSTAKVEVNQGNPSGWSGNLKALRIVAPDGSFTFDLNTYIVGGGNVGYHFSPNGNTGLVLTTPGNVGIGTTNPSHKLSVNGTIKAREVIVETTGWADDVFAPGYALPSLDSVEQHIAEKGHLPGIPSAAEVADQGVSVGEMQAALLRKVEELTLHLIQQQREIEEMKAQLKSAGIE